ncbi:Yip1 family protein [Streptomyces sp. NPDC060194]|uniref:Yip1 family protein n=1 Tax=Streptomyces sp. NPDC060194 TaxID=3347069 RepID=UPI00366773CF
MSQLGRKGRPGPPGPARPPAEPGTFDDVAGFRIGRGRDNRTQTQQPRRQPSQAPRGPQPYGGDPHGQNPPPYGRQGYEQQGHQGYGHPGQQGYGTRPGPARHGGQGYDEPEYFGGQPEHDPYAPHNNPGHTQAFQVGEDPYNDGGTYRAGAHNAPPAGPRLHWKDLLRGIVVRPEQTFFQMRDYPVWGPALIVTYLYGMLAVFGFDAAREDVISATLTSAIPIVLFTGVAVLISYLILGVVTHTLARQFGGDGAWQPTVGLAMLISAITDAPRLLFAMFLGGDNTLVTVLGWVTWLAAGALLTLMVSRSHDLPWPKALGASAVQLLALLSLIKLGTI